MFLEIHVAWNIAPKEIFIINRYFLRNKRLVGLHDSLEPDVRSAEASGLSLTQWRVGEKLARNQEIRREVSIEWTRVVTRNITSPVQQARRKLLETHLDEVSDTNLTSDLVRQYLLSWQVVSGLRWRSVGEIEWSDRDRQSLCYGDNPAGRVRPSSGLFLQEHIQSVLPTNQISQTKSP